MNPVSTSPVTLFLCFFCTASNGLQPARKFNRKGPKPSVRKTWYTNTHTHKAWKDPTREVTIERQRVRHSGKGAWQSQHTPTTWKFEKLRRASHLLDHLWWQVSCDAQYKFIQIIQRLQSWWSIPLTMHKWCINIIKCKPDMTITSITSITKRGHSPAWDAPPLVPTWSTQGAERDAFLVRVSAMGSDRRICWIVEPRFFRIVGNNPTKDGQEEEPS
jgi:hypothetical protein